MSVLTLSRKLSLLPLSFAFALLVVGGVAVSALSVVDGANRQVLITGEALSNHQAGDMMHDALRADVLAALLTGPDGAEAERDEVRKDLKEHADTFREALSANRHLALSPAIGRGLDELLPEMEEYIRAAEGLIEVALRDRAKAKDGLAGFLERFHRL